jgi:hypothetical protein
VERLQERIHFLAGLAGETRKGDELRRGLITEILDRIGKNDPQTLNRYIQQSRSSPVSCLVGLAGDANDYLNGKASLVNVLIDEDLGSIVEGMEAAEIDRYLICLNLLVKVIETAIIEEVYEVKSVSLGAPPGGKFEGEDVFIREYPVNVEIRGPSGSILNFIERLNDPDQFIPVAELRQLRSDKAPRDQDLLLADFELSALRIDPDAE